MAKWGMVIDISKCTGCYACFIACKDEYWDNDYPPYTAGQPKHGQFWMNLIKKERGVYPNIKVAYIPYLCMQCEDAPCLKDAKDGAIYTRPDGIVVIDPEKAVGQKYLVETCPYEVIFWNEERKLPQKCTFCVHRVLEGKLPRCIQSCPSGCLQFGDLDDPNSEVAKLLKSAKAEVYHPDFSPKNNVYYINLHKITKNFLAGAVVFGDVDECAEDVTVTLTDQSTGKTTVTRTNFFGNFDFDGLNSGKYSLKLEYRGYAPKSMNVNLKTDDFVGDIVLNRFGSVKKVSRSTKA